MSTFFISDLHIGHAKICEYSPERMQSDIDEHDEWIVRQWNKVVRSKTDLVWVLGDVCFDREKLCFLERMNGRKKLIRGNHDTFDTRKYLRYFEDVYGIHRRYNMWLTHAPVHPDSLRGLKNIHGHTHSQNINDPRYINVSVEQWHGLPVLLEYLK